MDNEKGSRYGVGDQVRIINYGHLICAHRKVLEFEAQQVKKKVEDIYSIYREEGGIVWYDMCPELVGKVGTIIRAKGSYGIDGLPGKTYWYHNNQLQLVKRKPNIK